MFAKRMLCAVALVSLALITAAFQRPSATPFPNFDLRPRQANQTAEEKKAVAKAQSQPASFVVDFDPITRNATHMRAEHGFLSGAEGRGRAVSDAALSAFSKNDPHRVTKAFLSQHRDLFGHGGEALDAATIIRNFTSAHNRLRTIVWEQRVDAVPVFEGVLISHTTEEGEFVSVSSHFASDAARTPQALAMKRAPKITAIQAVQRAAKNLDVQLIASDITIVEQEFAAEQKHRLAVRQLSGETTVELVWLPFAKDDLRFCWNVVLKVRSRGEVFRVLVDASTGEVILRRCLTAYLTNSTFRVFTGDSPSPFSPGWTTPNNGQPPLVSRSSITLAALNTNASPSSWIDAAVNETRGNNVDAHLDRDDDDLPDLPRPQGSPRHVFDFPIDLAQSPALYGDASIVQLFYWCNFMHDKLYDLGFTEAAGNFQVNNLGRGGLGNDAVQADAQDGGGFNNANMTTFNDGIAPRLQMYLFSGPNPDRDGVYDAEIVLHEYTHGLSSRRVGGGVGISELQTEGMGEGWSDFYALALLSEPGDDVNAPTAMAAYSTYQFGGLQQNYYYGIRRYPYSTDLTKNPLTFRDINPAQASSHSDVSINPAFGGGAADEAHNQGEVWCAVLWEMRANLITKHGWTNGNQLALQLVTDGMNLSPANPNFLQARDAIILADEVNNGGANRFELWSAFAKRGMGASATSPASFTTHGLHESFDLPDEMNVFPPTGSTLSGPVGGPFSPATETFSLRNAGSNALTWAASSAVNWLTLSTASGSLTTGMTANTSISVNSNANLLPIGVYYGDVRFTNETTGLVQSRTFTLRVGQPDYFTELFLTNLNISYSSFTFTPDGSSSFYSVCRDVATNFPSDPADGTFLTMTDDSLQRIFLTDGKEVSLYGTSSGSLELVSNGFLTIGGSDIDFSESVSDHFQLPRISALFRDLYPPGGGTISWLQLSNRLVVTFENVPEYVADDTNSFQIEWFFDGRIRFTYLQIDARSGLVGLSPGTGLPVAFQESDFDSYGACILPLTLAEMNAQTEGAGLLTNSGRVTLPFTLTTNITVMLTSSDVSEVLVPFLIEILAGETNGFFDITILDDAELDGTQSSVITAIAPGFHDAVRVLTVNDNESAILGIVIPPALSEGSVAFTQGMVIVNAPVNADVRVDLLSSDTTELQIPSFVIIPAGRTSAVFVVTLPDDSLIDGPQEVTITATVTNWISGNALVTVIDNEATNLVLQFTAPQVHESAGLLAGFGLIQISGALFTNLFVILETDDAALSITPSVVIPAGDVSAPFSVMLSDDNLINGTRLVSISATAIGFISGSNTLMILDDESPLPPANPQPEHLASNVIANTTLAWSASANTTNEVYFGATPTLGLSELTGTTTGTNWTLPLLVPATTYYWQIISSRVGSTASPVWSFTTRGVHHFVASGFATTQYLGIPFSMTFTPKDEFNTTVSNFTGVVQLSAGAGLGEIFHADFDSGLDGFVINNGWGNSNGLWHLTTARGTQAGHSGSSALYFGQNEAANGNGDYDLGGPTEGIVTSPAIHLAGLAAPITLIFNHLIQTEIATNWDHASVEISTNDGASYSVIAARELTLTNDSGGLWLTQAVDLTAFADSTATLRFHFDSVDGAGNNYEGWFIDDVSVSGSSNPVPMTPAVSGAFTNGSWSGNVTVFEAGTNVFIVAEDGAGHKATTSAFVVLGPPRVSLRVVDNTVIVTWPSIPGQSYRVETKAVFDEPWVSAGSDVTATGVFGAITNSLLPSGRFYRLRILP